MRASTRRSARTVATWRSCSSATDLVPGDTSPLEDIFVRDVQLGTTTRVTVGAERRRSGPRNSSRVIARIADMLRSPPPRVIWYPATGTAWRTCSSADLDAGATTRASVDTTDGDANRASGSTSLFSPPAIDADGSRVVFFSAASDLVPMDGNALSDVFVRDLGAGVTTRVSVDATGGDANGPSDQGNGRPGITGDGNVVAFASFASNLAPGDGNGAGSDVFVRDLRSSTTSLVSAASEGGAGASISDDGRFVVFQTTQIWVYDRVAGTTALASARFGRPANGISGNASVSADGRYVTFHSSADNLVTGDGNGAFDVYVRSVSMPTVASVRRTR